MKKLVFLGEIVAVASFSAFAAVPISITGGPEREAIARSHTGMVITDGRAAQTLDLFQRKVRIFSN